MWICWGFVDSSPYHATATVIVTGTKSYLIYAFAWTQGNEIRDVEWIRWFAEYITSDSDKCLVANTPHMR